MSASAWPTNTQIQEWFTDTGLAAGTYDYSAAAFAGRSVVEMLCGRTFLAPSAAAAYFDPPGEGLMRIPDLCTFTSLKYQPAGGTQVTLTQNTDFWLLPYDGAAISESPVPGPFTSVRFSKAYRAKFRWPVREENFRSLELTGRWGFGTELPYAIWQAARDAGVVTILDQILGGGSRAWRIKDGVALDEWAYDGAGGPVRRLTQSVMVTCRAFRRQD